jgi:thiamine-monophosphate kinase
LRAVVQAPLTEDGLIAAIAATVGAPPRQLRVGIGDDAAAWQPDGHHLSLLTTDMLVDGVHFRFGETTPEALGHKALAKSASDIAAMGGRPILAVIALGITAQLDELWVRSFYRSMTALASSSRCAIAGGDVVQAPVLTIAVTVVGEVRRTGMLLRSGAKPGDVIAVTGPLGMGAAGLRALDAGAAAMAPRAVQRYLTPEIRLAEGRYFGSRRAAHALMDLSDGLSTDVARLARSSGVDAVIEADGFFVHPEILAVAAATGDDPEDMLLNGGDDYELIAAIDGRAFPHVARTFERRFGRPLSKIGRFERGGGVVWVERDGRREPLPARGYDHLAPRKDAKRPR